LASVAEVRVALITVIASTHVASDAAAAAGDGLAGAVTAMACGGAQILGARRVPSARLVRRLQHPRHHSPISAYGLPRGRAQGRRTTDEPIPGDTQRGVVEGDVQDFYGATAVVMEEQHRRRVACVTGELEPWLAAQGAPGLDAQGVGHAHTAAAGRAAGHPNCILAGGHRCASHHDKPQPYECRRRKKWWPR